MRYRPLGPSGAIVSVISLRLATDATRSRAADWVSFVFAALENGISSFEVGANDPVVIEGLAEALKSVDRRLVFVSWRLEAPGARARDLSPQGLSAQIGAALARTGLDYLDALMIEEPKPGEVTPEAFKALDKAKASGSARFIGMIGDGDTVDEHLTTGGFDLLTTPFNITAGWKERNRVRSAAAAEMAIIGCQPYPRTFHAAAAAAFKAGAGKPGEEALRGVGSYTFLDRTHGWTAEAICLAYALTEPSLATVQVQPTSIAHLEQLAAVPEREMPPGLAAQIEMARFSPDPTEQDRRRA